MRRRSADAAQASLHRRPTSKTWEANVIAIGLSRASSSPWNPTSIHLMQHGIQKLLGLFPSSGINPVERDEYNRRMVNSYEPVRDFIILHYHCDKRTEAFWRQLREMHLPDSLGTRSSCSASTATSSATTRSCSTSRAGSRSCSARTSSPTSCDPLVDGDARIATCFAPWPSSSSAYETTARPAAAGERLHRDRAAAA